MKKYADNCAFWLRAHFEKHIRLITDDYYDREIVPENELKKYGTRSVYKNINNLDVNNCLILLKLKTTYNYAGELVPPKCEMDFIESNDESNLPNYLANYCLNILHKKYHHNQYQKQSAFLIFDEFFHKSYLFNPGRNKKWNEYYCKTVEGISRNFMYVVNKAINELSPTDFPLIEINGKRFFTSIRTKEGSKLLKPILKEARELKIKAIKEIELEAEKEIKEQNDRLDMAQIAKEWADDFWRECGEAGSNCESWPGWG